jgi:hypothetical protein
MSDATDASGQTRPTRADSKTTGVAVADHDGMAWMTWLSGIGLATAVVLALIGGLPVDVPMPTHRFGWVEPSCGLTRGSTAVVRGDFSTAWQYNPLSFVVIAFGVIGLARAAVGVLTGRWLNAGIRPTKRTWIALAIPLVAFWAYQQTNADFIINSRS